uniref:Uncharacterized protein n=1 Tax=Oryza glaberrima TaxID=4538 RepID=I1PNF3_ORYGL
WPRHPRRPCCGSTSGHCSSPRCCRRCLTPLLGSSSMGAGFGDPGTWRRPLLADRGNVLIGNSDDDDSSPCAAHSARSGGTWQHRVVPSSSAPPPTSKV